MERNRNEQFVDDSVVDPMAQEVEQTSGEEPQEDTPEKDEEKKPRVDPIMKHWGDLKGRPDDQQIENWKSQYGEVFLMSFDENDNYVWRPIKRLEYKNMLQQAKDDAHFQEMLVQRCVLWPHIGPERLTGGKAGTVPTLYNVIMEGSNFLDPQEAVMYVRKL